MIIKGKYNKAKVYTDVIDPEAINQITEICNSPVFEGAKIKIMPDVHSGKGSTIGTTITVNDKVVPSMVGVDIGCGMEVVELADKIIDFKALDKFIRENIPSGAQHRKERHAYSYNLDLNCLRCAKQVNLNNGYLSLGTLGGGNHFIEIDKDLEGTLYLVIHSGSRHLGVEVAEYYQKQSQNYHFNGKKTLKQLISDLKAEGREKDIQTEIDNARNKINQYDGDMYSVMYLEGELFDDYIHDMKIMQKFADLNRKAMTDSILQGLNLTEISRFTTVHNYIDMEYMILRKGAVSARKGEKLLIPINMKDGSLICIGKGNDNWNQSAPHGAGRLMSRKKARQTLSMEQFKKEMAGIFSTSISINTLDESPMAYKSADNIIKNIKPTATIVKRILPVYNFKADEEAGSTKFKKNK